MKFCFFFCIRNLAKICVYTQFSKCYSRIIVSQVLLDDFDYNKITSQEIYAYRNNSRGFDLSVLLHSPKSLLFYSYRKSTTYKESVYGTPYVSLFSTTLVSDFSFLHISSQLLDTATWHFSIPDVGVFCESRKHWAGSLLCAV